MLPLFCAPLQGYTDAIYRQNHAKFAGGIHTYYSPFLRVEKGEVRSRDLRDVAPENNQGYHLVPQVIFNGIEEFDILVNTLVNKGFQEIDLNMGCPFPMQTNHGRGSGILPHFDTVKQITDKIAKLSQIKFSIKMRLGLENADEALKLLPLLNDIPLVHLTMHPRIGRQQYKGALDEIAFKKFYEECCHPIIFNGDVQTVARIQQLEATYPKLKGVMLGRGLLTNPLLAVEYRSNKQFPATQRKTAILDMHQGIFNQARETLQDSNQMLNRMRAFWEYQTDILPSKVYKRIMKCRSFEDYKSITSEIELLF